MMHANVKEHWFAICRSSELRRSPRAAVLFNRPIVVFRTDDGVHALLDRCPHRHAPLSGGTVVDNQIQCRYHGWKFDRSGECALIPGLTSGPPRCSVPAFACQEQEGIVWVSPEGDGTGSPPSIAFAEMERHKQVWSRFVLRSTLFDAIENFVDPMHTHTVHAGLIRTEKKRSPVQIQIRCQKSEVCAHYLGEGTSSGLIQRLFGVDIVRSLGRFRLPSIVEMEYWNEHFLRCRIVLLFTPAGESEVNVLAGVFGRHALAPLILPILKPMLRLAVRQDRNVLRWKHTHESAYFGKANYLHTELDLLGPYILHWFRHGKLDGRDREVEILI